MKKLVWYSLLWTCTYVAAQPPSASSLSTDEKAVRATIERLFEGMRKGDSSLVRSTFHPEARLQTTFTDKSGKPMLRTESIEGFVAAVGKPHTEVWDERIQHYEIRIDDNLATAWTPYAFYIDQTFSHQGVNAFQLFRSAEGWKIIHIADTRRKK